MNNMGQIIMLKRKKLRYTQELMAERLHITPATYSRYENGQIQIPHKRLESICDILGLNIGELFNEPETVKEPETEYITNFDPYKEIIRLQNELITLQKQCINERKKQ